MSGEQEDAAFRQAARTDQKVQQAAPKFPILLLGPAGDFLELRVEAAEALEDKGYRCIVMEKYTAPTGMPLIRKWETILEEEKPRIYVFVIPKDEPLRGPHVEFGYLLCHLGDEALRRRAQFFLEDGLKTKETLAAYETQYIGNAGANFYEDAAQLARRIERRVYSFILDTF